MKYFNKNLLALARDVQHVPVVFPAQQYLTQASKTLSLTKLKKTQLLVGFSVFFRKPLKLKKIKKEFKEDAIFRQLLYRYATNLLGSSLSLIINKNLAWNLTIYELGQVWLLAQRLFSLMPVSPFAYKNKTYPWKFGGISIYQAIKLKDPHLLLEWLRGRLFYMNLFTHQNYFRNLGSILKEAVLAPRGKYHLRGFQLYIVGKISVTGNARSRTYYAQAGQFSSSNLKLRLTSKFLIIRTKTGCLGLSIKFLF